MAKNAFKSEPGDGKKNLILIGDFRFRVNDLEEIAREVVALRPDIAVHLVAPNDTAAVLSDEKWRRPTITVSFGIPGKFEPKRGPLFYNHVIDRFAQLKRMREAGIPVPRTETFAFHRVYDPRIWSPLVLIKPISFRLGSSGLDTHAVRTNRVHLLQPDHFKLKSDKPGVPLARTIQPFIDTGDHPSRYRALLLFGEPLYVQLGVLDDARADLNSATDEELFSSMVDINGGERSYFHGDYPDIVALAKRIADAFAEIPILGIDILKDIHTGDLFALEVNAGGNIWHFSSHYLAHRREKFPHLAEEMKAQFGAWQAAARSLARKTDQHAA
jgi:hypothetical protein